MKKIKSIFGYVWAISLLLIAPATFFGHGYFSEKFAETTRLTIHPQFSGGEVISVVDHGVYKTFIHRPVFDALFGLKKKGFIQVRWEPADGLPEIIKEKIDYNRNGKKDFIIMLNTSTGEVTLIRYNAAVISVEKSYQLSNGWAVRVLLKR